MVNGAIAGPCGISVARIDLQLPGTVPETQFDRLLGRGASTRHQRGSSSECEQLGCPSHSGHGVRPAPCDSHHLVMVELRNSAANPACGANRCGLGRASAAGPPGGDPPARG